jgi:beta-glucanase (GH16 family)
MLLILVALVACSQAYYVRVFNEEFNDLDNWVVEVKTGEASGNWEWEYFTNRTENVFIRQSELGNSLVLKAIAEEYQGYHYTSGRVHSASTFGPYGFFNVYAKVPKGSALWPAIWMLPVDDSLYGTWAACGEIDIMETICEDEAAFSTLHFGQTWPKNVQYPQFPNNTYPFTVDWNQPHWFGVDWQPTYMRFYMDATVVEGTVQGGRLINEISSDNWFSADLNGTHYGGSAPFDGPFNFILNLSVGGSWPCSVQGCCDKVAVPAELEVFKVQAYGHRCLETE